MTMLVTGAAGFIGSAFVRHALKNNNKVVVLDKLTYAGHLENLDGLIDNETLFFEKGDITDQILVPQLFKKYRFEQLVNFAAESHVDNSIASPWDFIDTNIIGTFNLLECSKNHWNQLDEESKKKFRYLQVSTDEVYGTLGETGKFHEEKAYEPNSPYSSTKAAADHLVRAWHHTYGLPTITTNCSNNYGPRQFPEKLIPLMIINALKEKPLPVYGNGGNIRDWIHVEDHSAGVYLALTKGQIGQTYCLGGRSERKNLDVVKSICKILDEVKPRYNKKSYSELITFIQDRAGHDWRYAIDDSKAESELGFKRQYINFEDGLAATVKWYLDNNAWVESVQTKKF